MALRLSGVSPRRAAARALFIVCALFVFTGALHAQQRHPQSRLQVETLPAPANVRAAAPEPEAAYAPPGYPDESYSWDEGAPYDGFDDCGGCGTCCNGCGSCGTCCNGYGGDRGCCISGWVGAEYLRWQIDGDPLPPLAVDSPEGETPNGSNTRILSGGQTYLGDYRDGLRIFAGVWLDCNHCCSIEADYFWLGSNGYDSRVGNEPGRIVGRPFFDSETGTPAAEFVSIPDQLAGTVDSSLTDDFQGGGVALNRCFWRCCNPCDCSNRTMNWIAGYRHYSYDSSLTITEDLDVLEDTLSEFEPGTKIFVRDSFAVRNEFHGADLGLAGSYQCGWFWIDGLAKIALGSNRRTVVISGLQSIDPPTGVTTTFPRGLLTSNLRNSGTYRDDDFVGIPEFRVGIGALLARGLSIRAGYNVIIWNDVMRVSSALPPGLAVDPRNIAAPDDPDLGTGGPDPRFAGIRGSSMVAHGLSAGLEWAF